MLKKIKEIWFKIKPNLYIYLIAIAIPIAVGIFSAALTRSSMDIYSKINTPPLAPPAILFPIVWTLLYVLMGISSAIIYLRKYRDPEAAKKGLTSYVVSLILNFSWSIIFFRLQASFFALLVLLVLLYTIIKTIIEYRKVSLPAAYLQIPYAIWVAFAGYLNAGIWYLN